MPRRKQNLGAPPGLVEGDDLSTEGSDRAWVYEIYLELRQQILENRLSLRPRFTSTDLKSLYPSSSTSAGVVLQWLAAEGYLVFHEPFSYEVKHWPPEEIQDRYRIRIPIEAAAAFDAAERIGSRHLLALKAAHVAATQALRALLDDATGAVLPPADRRWRSDFTEEPVLIDFGKGTLDAFGSVSSRVIKAARKRYWFDNPPDAWR